MNNYRHKARFFILDLLLLTTWVALILGAWLTVPHPLVAMVAVCGFIGPTFSERGHDLSLKQAIHFYLFSASMWAWLAVGTIGLAEWTQAIWR